MDSTEQAMNIVNEVCEAFLSMLSAGYNYDEVYKTSKEMLPRNVYIWYNYYIKK